ncbi:Rpn family recombination-promoting nuclease/putative transposase [uncultured Robinsoniella sp.]|uniref:Rpn family recombination-promoting nuclease/putative transposase n=1 Tax=uncultured Robinsoniella sp. TaxID=904190 RepID=UPI00374F30F3
MKDSPKTSVIQNEEDTTEPFIMLPTVDFCFKELMCSEKARKGLIAAFLNLDPKDIQETELLNTALRKKTENEKLGILDVKVKMQDNTQIDLEMQVLPFHCWEERTLFYTCKMYTDQIVSGDNYDVLVKCIQISILDFEFLKDTDAWYSCFHLREDQRGSLYSDKLELHVLELPKLGAQEEPENELLQWAKFLNGKREEDFREMAEKNEYINEAYQILKSISEDERKRHEYESREKAIRDHNHIMYIAKKAEKDMQEAKEKVQEAREMAQEAREKVQEAREIAQEEREKVQEAREIAQEAREKAQEERKKAEEARKQAEEARRKVDEEREKAEEERKKALAEGLEFGHMTGMEAGIEVFIKDNLEEGIICERIIAKLQNRFHMDFDTAAKYYEKYK